MKNKLTLSEQSKSFIENLRLYLFSNGKNSNEIEEIVEELEIHLYEAEKRGKPIEKVVGKSPKEYMEMISNEMTTDYRAWIKYILLLIVGAFSITIIGDVLNKSLSYSVLEIIGHIAIAVIFIFSVSKGFKYISITKHSSRKQIAILLFLGLLPVALFIGLFFLNKIVDTPIIHFNNTASMIIGIVTLLFIIGMSIWSKTWILIVVVAFTTLPKYLLNQVILSADIKLILEMMVMFAGIGIYLWITNHLAKKKEKVD